MKQIKKHKNILLLIVIVIGAICFGRYVIPNLGNTIQQQNVSTSLGFEDIGELATESSLCNVVSSVEDTRKFFDLFNIPGTTSKFIFSYNVQIKAGYNFSDIEYNVTEKTIKITLPDVKILESNILMDSLTVLYSSESIFNDFTIEENAEAIKSLQDQAEKTAIENGLLDNAYTNAKTLLTAFIGQTII